VISAIYGGIGGTILASLTGLAESRTGLLDPFRQSRLHGGTWRQRDICRPGDCALVFVVLQDFVMSITQYWRFVMGGVLVLLVVFMPQGLSGTIEALVNRRAGGDENAARRAADTAPLFEPSTSRKPLVCSRPWTMSLFMSVTASLSRSSDRMEPARPRWSTS